MKQKIKTLAGLRRAIRRLLAENEQKFESHRKEVRGMGRCLGSCEEKRDYQATREALLNVMALAGGRI